MANLTNYSDYDALGLAELVRKGDITAGELMADALGAIQQLNPELNCVVGDLSTQAERALDEGLPDGPFTGVPFLIKEIGVQAAGSPFRMGSKLCDGFVPQADTELMTRFRCAGLLTIGTTPTPEFGFNPTCEFVFHGPTHNPWDVRGAPVARRAARRRPWPRVFFRWRMPMTVAGRSAFPPQPADWLA
jgi:amidase